MATARESVNYASAYTNKYLQDARTLRGRAVPMDISFLTVSATATGDTYKVGVIPANAKVVGLEVVGEGLSASAGVNGSVKIGDSGDDDRYMKATDFDVVEARGTLAYAGVGYTPTADTIVIATVTGVHLAGKNVKGTLWIVPGV